ADEAEIGQRPRREGGPRLEVVGVATRDDDGVSGRGEADASDPRGDVVDDHFRGRREALGVRELLAVVDDMNAESDFVRDAREVESDMAAADDVQLRRRLDRLDVDVHLSAADETSLLREVVRQLVVHDLWRATRDRLARFPECVVLVAAAADGADDPPVAEYEH